MRVVQRGPSVASTHTRSPWRMTNTASQPQLTPTSARQTARYQRPTSHAACKATISG